MTSPTGPTPSAPGWYPSPEWPNLDQYWTGTSWSKRTRAPLGDSTSGSANAAPPAPGWYPSPANPAAEQYWDGAQWTPSVRAASTAPPPTGATPSPSAVSIAAPNVQIVGPKVPDQTLYAWGIAFTPLVFVPFLAMLNPLWQLVPLAITVVALVFLARRDRSQLRADGRDASWPVWLWLLGPVIVYPVVYLIRRTLAVRSTVALPIVAAVIMTVVAVLAFSGYRPSWAPTGGDSFTFTSSETATIETGIGEQIGEVVSADCGTPRKVSAGDQFMCYATLVRTGDAFKIRVVIRTGGEFQYRVVG